MYEKKLSIFVLLATSFMGRCHSDIVCTNRLRELTSKCVYIEPLKTEDPHIGMVLGEVITKEFVRQRFEMCDANSATMFVSGSAFLTERSTSKKDLFGASGTTSQAVESVSLIVKNRSGEILATASYDNDDRFAASKLGTELGGALASKLK